MALVEYTCDTCKRSLSLPQNKLGVDMFSRCIITNNCKGTLTQVHVKSEYIIGNRVPEISKYDDWIQRKILYTHYQSQLSTKWYIKHNLNNIPEVEVYFTDLNTPEPIRYNNFNTNVISLNEVELILESHHTGYAQCIAKFNNTEIPTISTTVTSLQTITWDNYLTVCIPIETKTPILTFSLIPPNKTTSQSVDIDVPLLANNTSLAWGDVESVYVYGRTYKIFTIPMSNLGTANYNFDQYSFKIKKLGGRSLSKNTVLFLLSTGQTTVDKVITHIIDSDIFSTTPLNIITNNNIKVDTQVIKSVYPSIILV
jgi:hypothetical protein